MKVKELIKELEQMPQDLDVVLQTCGIDNEGWMPMTITGSCNWSINIDDYDGLIDATVCIYAEEPDWNDEEDDDICDECYDCKWFWQNNDTGNECNGEKQKCHEYDECK